MTVVLGTPAPFGGLVVTLASSDSTLASISPNSVFIPAGATTSATQPVVTAQNVGTATITASAPNYLTASQSVTVTATITMSPTSLVIPSGGTRLLALVLSAPAPSPDSPVTPDRGAGGFVNGLTVQLSSSNPGVATLQPSTQFYSDGSSITTVVVVVYWRFAGYGDHPRRRSAFHSRRHGYGDRPVRTECASDKSGLRGGSAVEALSVLRLVYKSEWRLEDLVSLPAGLFQMD